MAIVYAVAALLAASFLLLQHLLARNLRKEREQLDEYMAWLHEWRDDAAYLLEETIKVKQELEALPMIEVVTRDETQN